MLGHLDPENPYRSRRPCYGMGLLSIFEHLLEHPFAPVEVRRVAEGLNRLSILTFYSTRRRRLRRRRLRRRRRISFRGFTLLYRLNNY
jgi:hypothetical protein